MQNIGISDDEMELYKNKKEENFEEQGDDQEEDGDEEEDEDDEEDEEEDEEEDLEVAEENVTQQFMVAGTILCTTIQCIY
jgi:TATA-binding protein-associated factor Taf7